MNEAVALEKLEAAVRKILTDYETEAERTTKDCVRKAGLAGARALRGVSPVRSGDYAKDWTAKAEEGRLYSTSTVYNRKEYRLAHLLEKGHAASNQYGGPFGSVAARVHIKPVEETIIQQFETELTVGLSKG